ncbi:hypothetical protein RhiirA4_512171 [Rhizophagus irregularis]|uniref:Uncharacterized protein n=1 Tax=Rhizophagus irregularis TaxID=588596 RepID=A0A2I1HHJ2_9GLOM|nr:hypothetical protein RhiirA4_512171 [Rhizophagus irregularis]
MSKSAPFVRKWSDAHSEPQYFNTQEDLEKHVFRDHVKSTELSSFIRVYRCIWEGCKEQLSNITKLEVITFSQCIYGITLNRSQSHLSARFRSSDEPHHHLIYRHIDSVMDYAGANYMTKHENGTFYSFYILKLKSYDMFYVFSLKIIKIIKRDDNRYYGKSNDEIIWETLCSYNDPKKVVVEFNAIKYHDEASEEISPNRRENSSAKNSPIVSTTSMGPFKATGILGPEIDLVAAADASAEITPYLLICGIYNNRLLVNNKNFKNG